MPLRFQLSRGILIKYYKDYTFLRAQKDWGGKAMLLERGRACETRRARAGFELLALCSRLLALKQPLAFSAFLPSKSKSSRGWGKNPPKQSTENKT